MTKIAAKQIKITRAEGMTDVDDFNGHTFFRDYLLDTVRRVRQEACGFVSLDTLGKIGLLTIVIWAMFEWLGNWWTDGNGHERLASIAIMVAVLLGIGGFIFRKLSRWRYHHNLFRLRFPEQWPVTSTEPQLRRKTVLLGQSEVLVEIALGASIYIDHFDVRFLAGGKGGNVDPNVIRVTGVRDRLRNVDFALPQDPGETWGRLSGMLMVPHEAAGGMDCYYTPPLHIDSGRGLFLIISFEAKQPWSGCLGFRGRDKNGEKVSPSHARFIVQEPQAPDKEELHS